MPDARFPLAGSPPGKGSQRADLSPAAKLQPQRIATGQPYGSAKQQEQIVSARPLENNTGVPGAGPAPSPSPVPSPPPAGPAGGGQRTPFGGGGMDPAAVLAAVSGNPSQRPAEPITAGVAGQPLGAGFKLDVLRHIATLPFAGPEIQQMVAKAYTEANVANNYRVY